MYLDYTRLGDSLACLSWYNSTCHPAQPFLPPAEKGHLMMHRTCSREIGLYILRQCKENLVGVTLMGWHHFLFSIFRMKSWKNWLDKAIFNHSKIVFVFLSVLIYFLLASSWVAGLPDPSHHHRCFSLHLFACGGPLPGFAFKLQKQAGWPERHLQVDLGLWKQEKWQHVNQRTPERHFLLSHASHISLSQHFSGYKDTDFYM